LAPLVCTSRIGARYVRSLIPWLLTVLAIVAATLLYRVLGASMRTVLVAWVLTVVTLICIALTIAFWTECAARSVVVADIPPERRSVEISARGWRAIDNDERTWCRPRLYRLFGY
jgi:hypothetical protein